MCLLYSTVTNLQAELWLINRLRDKLSFVVKPASNSSFSFALGLGDQVTENVVFQSLNGVECLEITGFSNS